jgi:hypothetical protein
MFIPLRPFILVLTVCLAAFKGTAKRKTWVQSKICQQAISIQVENLQH